MASFNLDPVLMISNSKIWIPNKWDFYSIFVNNVYFYISALTIIRSFLLTGMHSWKYKIHLKQNYAV